MKKFITIAAVAAFGLLGSVNNAGAATSAELQAQIDALLAQLAGLSGEATVTSATPYNHVVTLRVGSRGTQVSQLQACMNALGYSTGTVDGIFGNNTKSGVMQFQAAKGLVVDGIIGPATGPQFEMACNGTVVVVEDDEDDSDSDVSDFDTTGGEEGEIVSGSLKIKLGDDDELYSDEKGQEAFTFEVEAEEEGSDVLIERVDLTFSIAGDDTRGWKVLEVVALEVDGDEVASMDVDSKSDWRGSSDDTVRLANVNTVVEADEKVEFSVMLDTAELDLDSVDTDITLTNVEVRYIDEAGITNYESATSTKTATAKTLTGIDFDLDENNDNPDDETYSLNEDVDGVVAFVNDLQIDDESGTVEDVTVTFGFDADLSAFDIDDLVSDARFIIDGDEYDADDVNAIAAGGPGSTFTIDFDLDEMEVEIDDEFEVSVELDLNELDTAVAAEAAFIGVELKAISIDFSGEDSSEDAYGPITENVDNAPEINLSAGALTLEDSDVDGYNEIGSDDLAAKAKFVVELKADGDEDMRVNGLMFKYNNAAATATVPSGYTVTVKDGDGDAVALTAGTTTFATAFDINDGSSEEFTVTVIYDNTGIATGEYELELDSVSWTEDTLGNGFTSGTTAGSLDTSLEADSIDLLDA